MRHGINGLLRRSVGGRSFALNHGDQRVGLGSTGGKGLLRHFIFWKSGQQPGLDFVRPRQTAVFAHTPDVHGHKRYQQ